MLIGYMRVSKADGSQGTDLQRDALLAASFFQGLIDRGQVSSRQDLAKALRITKGRVSQKLAILTLPSEVQDVFSQHPFLGELHARVLRRLSNEKTRERALATMVSRQLTGRQAEVLVDRYLSKNSDGPPKSPSVEFQDAILRRTRTGYTLRLPDLPGPELSQLLSRLARAIKDHKVSLPGDESPS